MSHTPDRMPSAPFIPVIPAGGSGTRLWPLSRRSRPKFLLDLVGTGDSLLQATIARLEPLADARPIVVTGIGHRSAVQEQVGDRAEVIAEPSPRNSMPAIALAAALVERREPTAVIGSFAADHLIAEQDQFTRAVQHARSAAELGYLVTLGIEPTGPSTAFGYIESAASSDGAGEGLEGIGAEPVRRFVEKPDAQTAREFLAAGGFRWNAGMFVVGARVLLDALAEQIPQLAAGAREIAAAHGTPQQEAVLERVWPSLMSIAIDHALAEPLAAQGRVAVVPARFDWDDVGDYAALSRQLRAQRGMTVHDDEQADEEDLAVVGAARVVSVGSRATVHSDAERPIALVGLDGVTVVETESALLVLAEDQAQRLSDLVGDLEEQGLGDLR